MALLLAIGACSFCLGLRGLLMAAADREGDR